MDAAYLKAAHPEPYRILSVKLRPFCMGHEILFQRFGVAFSIENTGTPEIGDLLKAVYICSRPYRNDEDLSGFHVPFRARIYAKLFGQKYTDAAVAAFWQYLRAHTEVPEYSWEEKNENKETGAPLVQTVKVALMKNTGRSESEVLNMPFSLAFWDYLTLAESNENIQIVSEKEAKQRAEEDRIAKEMEDKVNAFAAKMFSAEQGVSCSA